MAYVQRRIAILIRSVNVSTQLGAQINDANGKTDIADKYKLLLVQNFPNSKEAKQISSNSNIQPQPAAFDARKLLENEQIN